MGRDDGRLVRARPSHYADYKKIWKTQRGSTVPVRKDVSAILLLCFVPQNFILLFISILMSTFLIVVWYVNECYIIIGQVLLVVIHPWLDV